MAIIVEEQKDRYGIVNVLIYLVVLGILATAAYYVFIRKPQSVEFVVPATFQSTQELLSISVNPDDVVLHPQFQALKKYITPAPPRNLGRPNPFVSF